MEKEKSPEGKISVGGQSQNKNHFQQRKTKFEGRCDKLKGHICNCSDSRQVDKFSTNLKKTINYLRKNYKQGKDIAMALEMMEPFIIPLPKVAPPKGISDPDTISNIRK
eukprot:6040673-Ditylum_brightwellii.AAC.1